MRYMITWRTRPGLYAKAVKQFLETGGPVVGGMHTVARWHVPGSVLGWHLVEGDDMVSLAQHMAEWAETLELEVHPVIADEQAGEAATRVYGG